jgi:hypothetical protein
MRNCFYSLTANVPSIHSVAKLGTDYFLLKIKILAKRKREFTKNSQLLETAVRNLCLLLFIVVGKICFPFPRSKCVAN